MGFCCLFMLYSIEQTQMKKPGGVFMQLHSKCNAIASRLKVTIVTTIKKGLPGNPHIAHIAHYKKRSRERHKTKNKRLANFLAVPKWKKIAP